MPQKSKILKTETKKEIRTVKAPLVDALNNYLKNPTVQFHIPGHTKGQAAFRPFKKLIGDRALLLDTTDEFDGLGTLHPATGPIKEAQELAAKAFNAKKTFFLLSGSTIGNLALGMSLTNKNKEILVNRNCHRSILTGLIISGAKPIWIAPKKLTEWSLWASVSAEDVEFNLKQNPNISMVWLTNPTYEGVVSDVRAISKVCKKYNVPLLIDEAHGCLWNFNKKLPQTALQLGADAVLHSLHKTGGSMSQSSMLHISKDSILDIDAIEKSLQLLQTTSPSMILLSSLDAARANLESFQGQQRIEKAVKNALYIRSSLSKIKGINILEASKDFNIDITKIFVKVDGLSGKRLESILEIDYKIEVESASDEGVLILSNIGNSTKDAEYLVNSLKSIVEKQYSDIYFLEGKKHMPMIIPQTIMTPREAFYSEKIKVKKEDAIGKISAEVIAECPPGISILLPGELITKEHLPYLSNYEYLDVLK